MLDLLVFVLSNQVHATQLLKVLIVLPKLVVVALTLKARDFIENAQIDVTFFRAEVLRYLRQELYLVFGQLILVCQAIYICAIFLD